MDSGIQKEKASLLRRKKVLVTGGCGFIGGHLVDTLLEGGAEVTVFDTVTPQDSPHVKIIQGDVRDYSSVEGALKGQEIVFHLAAMLGVEAILDKPLQVLEVNLQGTVNVLRAAAHANVSRLVFGSSSEVYGEPRTLPISESDALTPLSTYGVSKLAAEEYVKAFWVERRLEYAIVRYFNAYGPRQKERFVMPIFISQVLKNESPVIFGSGEQIRCYTYVDDVVTGTLLAASSPRAANEVFNIGNEQPISIKNMANYIIQVLNGNVTPVFRYFGTGIRTEGREVQRRIPDISKARYVLGFRPQVSFEEGVKKFIEWYRTHPEVMR